MQDYVDRHGPLLAKTAHTLTTAAQLHAAFTEGRERGYALDLEAVLEACAANGTVVEINANPYRLDLDWRDVLRWRERLTFAINTDAHVPGGLGDTRYGVAMARKAGLTPARVVNTLSRDAFLAFVAQQRAARG